MHSLRSILQIHWQDKATNLGVLERAQTTSIEVMIMKAQLQGAGMSSTWVRQKFLDSFSVMSSLKAKDSRDAHASGSKTASRPTSGVAAPVLGISTVQQGTETNGEPSPGLFARPSRKTVANA